MVKPQSFDRSSFAFRLLGAALVIPALVAGISGCADETTCELCNEEELFLQSISGRNYRGEQVHLLSPPCEGDRCWEKLAKGRIYIDDIVDCVDSEVAIDSARGAEAYCKVSPLLTNTGLDVVFNNLLVQDSIQIRRDKPQTADPQATREIFEWNDEVMVIEGPTTRFNGDYQVAPSRGETSIRSVNLSCLDSLADKGKVKDWESLASNPTFCDVVENDGGSLIPLRMQVTAEDTDKSPQIGTFDGELDARLFDCVPNAGANTCCTACGFELSVNVAKYGAKANGTQRTPNKALTCDPTQDPLSQCRTFVPSVNRDWETSRFSYSWKGKSENEWRLPLYDKVRETHPDERPARHVRTGASCETSTDCLAAGLTGTQCLGTNADGNACDGDYADPDCVERTCQASWFVGCRANADTTGPEGRCVDSRFLDRGAGACFEAETQFSQCASDDPTSCITLDEGSRLSLCDSGDLDRELTAAECCQDTLGSKVDGAACDPLFQANVKPIDRHDRSQSIPETSANCFCGDPGLQPDYCAEQIETNCTAPWGSLAEPSPGNALETDPSSNEGSYVTRFVSRDAGIHYNPALKGINFRTADTGSAARSMVESCAEQLVPDFGAANYLDGWRRNTAQGVAETNNDFDRGLCSGQKYSLHLNAEGEKAIVDIWGNTLVDRATFTFETSQFHIQPESGFPDVATGMGGCNEFEFKLSNKYDLSPGNLKKVSLWKLIRRDNKKCNQDDIALTDSSCWDISPSASVPVAGGQDCVEDPNDYTKGSSSPCLSINVDEQDKGALKIRVPMKFGPVLKSGVHYRVVIPSIGDYSDMEALADATGGVKSKAFKKAYSRAFHDVCGMPLVDYGEDRNGVVADDHIFDIRVTGTTCGEDADFDGIAGSCDNAPEIFNPGQQDADQDGVGDIADLCPAIAGDVQTADDDKDGIGNVCDSCSNQTSFYNDAWQRLDPQPPTYMLVRNIPNQGDADQDGIGDVCDNCPSVANCENYSVDNPHSPGAPISGYGSQSCQTDANQDWVGDACEGLTGDLAAGPVGPMPDDDFDQDGIANIDDYCPRQPVVATTCATDDECSLSTCNVESGICNHADADSDRVGDICDSCPEVANPAQVLEGGAQLDDPDQDFVGSACETAAVCEDAPDPRPIGFYSAQSEGHCCVTTYSMPEFSDINPNPAAGDDRGDGWFAAKPDSDGMLVCRGKCDRIGFPIKKSCKNEANPDEDKPTPENRDKCRSLPEHLMAVPGVTRLPAGCQEAGSAIKTADYDGRLDELWGMACLLPQLDLDFDGLGDMGGCDSCVHSFDPYNEPFITPSGDVSNTFGRYCAGDYSLLSICDELPLFDPEYDVPFQKDEGGPVGAL